MKASPASDRPLVREALRLLGKRRLALAIHDASFPAAGSEDLGRGSPYSAGGLALARFAHELGFDGLQLGPQGLTAPDNPSPYDGTLFSRNVVSIDFFGLARDLAWRDLVPLPAIQAAAAASPARDPWRAEHRPAFDAARAGLAEIARRFRAARANGSPRARPLAEALAAFRARHRSWLEPDSLYEAISAEHGHTFFRDWPEESDRLLFTRGSAAAGDRERRLAERLGRHAEAIEEYALGQMIVHEQHARFREAIQPLGLALFGDLQVGAAPADLWSRAPLFLQGYRMGAPPSRTNPQGQPWGYPVLDPALFFEDGGQGPAQRFFRARVGKMLDEYDGLRIDHPHGIVCPWMYRADEPDALGAVQSGARLYSAPGLPDHPELARYAIARQEQIDASQPRHADGWVRELEPQQVEQYSVLLDALVQEYRAHGRDPRDLPCEVLSTLPYPLARVLERHGLGRFRVTQKANLADPRDVYRSENAQPEDWVMVGTHDTPPVWRLAEGWPEAEVRRQAGYLAWRLSGGGDEAGLASLLASDRRRLVLAKVADLFACPARQVIVFFSDLFGMRDVYNAPGTVQAENWSLRLPPFFASLHQDRAARGEALDLSAALALALRARQLDLGADAADLAARLEERAAFRG